MKKKCTPATAQPAALTLGVLAVALTWAVAPQAAHAAAIGIGGANPLSYSQNFDSLASSGNNQTILPSGWAISLPNYRTGQGGNNAGDIYSFGANGNSERALGSLASNATGPLFFGAQFQNTSGLDFLNLQISYRGEQWRRGNGAANTLFFEVSTDATSLTDNTGTWTSISALDFVAPRTTGGDDRRLNGNAAANRTALASSFLLSAANNANFWIRWRDPNDPNNDDGLAIDNFLLTATPVPTPALLPGLVGFAVSAFRKRRQLAKVTKTQSC